MSTVTEQPAKTLERGFVGQSIPRKEDRRLVQGQGTFFDDVRRHGMGYVHFVRSPYGHAKIVSIDVSKALALEGVYGTITGDEVAIQTDPFFEMSVPPGNMIKDYALAVGKVRFQGEPVVAVVAASRELARDAAELVEVDYEPLPAVLTIAQAIEALAGDRLAEHYGELAHHYSRSGNTQQAVAYLQRAGQQAADQSAYGEAIIHLTRGLELLQSLPETPERTRRELDGHIALGWALIATSPCAT